MNLFKVSGKKKTREEEVFDYSDPELLEKGFEIHETDDYKLYIHKETGVAKLSSNRKLTDFEIARILTKHLGED